VHLCRICWRGDFLHGGEEVGCLRVRDGESERGVVRERGEGVGGAWEQFCRDIARDGVLRGRRVDGAGVGEDERHYGDFLRGLKMLVPSHVDFVDIGAYLLFVNSAPAIYRLPLPVCFLANPQALAAGQKRLEVHATDHISRVPLEQPLVQYAEVRVARHECDGDNCVYGVRACLLCDSEQYGRDAAVVPGRAGLLGVAGALPATGEVSEHCWSAEVDSEECDDQERLLRG